LGEVSRSVPPPRAPAGSWRQHTQPAATRGDRGHPASSCSHRRCHGWCIKQLHLLAGQPAPCPCTPGPHPAAPSPGDTTGGAGRTPLNNQSRTSTCDYRRLGTGDRTETMYLNGPHAMRLNGPLAMCFNGPRLPPQKKPSHAPRLGGRISCGWDGQLLGTPASSRCPAALHAALLMQQAGPCASSSPRMALLSWQPALARAGAACCLLPAATPMLPCAAPAGRTMAQLRRHRMAPLLESSRAAAGGPSNG